MVTEGLDRECQQAAGDSCLPDTAAAKLEALDRYLELNSLIRDPRVLAGGYIVYKHMPFLKVWVDKPLGKRNSMWLDERDSLGDWITLLEFEYNGRL